MEAWFSILHPFPSRQGIMEDADTHPGTEPVSTFWLRWVKWHWSEKVRSEEAEDSKTFHMLAVTAVIKRAVPCQPHSPCWLSDAWLQPEGASTLQTKCFWPGVYRWECAAGFELHTIPFVWIVQQSATPWMPLKRDRRTVCILIPICRIHHAEIGEDQLQVIKSRNNASATFHSLLWAG